MFEQLKYHPFPVEAFFESSLVVTFAVPVEQLMNMIPAFLELDTLNDKFGFVAVAMVQTKDLRPKGSPKLLGSDFFLIGYRIFVRYVNNKGKKLRGLYILKSETDKKRMEWLGNIFTNYKYTTTDIRQEKNGSTQTIFSEKSAFKVEFDITRTEIPLPQHSPFEDWKEARRFAGPLPFTFSTVPKINEVLIIEGIRQNWKPAPIQIISCHFSYLNSLGINNAVLANAFIINNVPYSWGKGRLEKWK